MLILAPHLTQAGNDKEQIAPMLDAVQALPEGLNQPQQLLADTGYFSANNVDVCHGAQIEPLIAVGRDGHHPAWRERFEEPAPLRSEEHTSELQSLMRNSYAVFCLKKKI